MAKEQVTCKGCHNVALFDNPNRGCFNVGEVMEQTGFHYISKPFQGGSFWLCPECFQKGAAIAQQMVEICGIDFHFPSFLTKEQRDSR